MFNAYDRNRSGALELEELQSCLEDLGLMVGQSFALQPKPLQENPGLVWPRWLDIEEPRPCRQDPSLMDKHQQAQISAFHHVAPQRGCFRNLSQSNCP